MSQSKNWCFTLNNPTNEETERFLLIADNPDIQYIVYQLEAGVVGTVHFQGYVQFIKRVRLSQVKAALSPRCHVERALGTPDQNRSYCTKEPRSGGPFEFGEMVMPGKRTDIESFVAAMKERILPEAEILEAHPLILAKYPRFVSTTRRILSEGKLTNTPLIPRSVWQGSLIDDLHQRPDPRKVRWYCDEHGNTGKSFFARHFRLRDGGSPFIVTGGRHPDIYYAYKRQRVVIFDWPRSNEETFPYAVIEAFKNGYFLSTKYESSPIMFDTPHVVVFSNFYPDKSKLSVDRWDIHIIDNSLLHLPPLSLPPPSL